MYITWLFVVLLNLFSYQNWKRPQAEVIPIGTATIAVTFCCPQGHWIKWEFVFVPSKTPLYLWTSVLTFNIQLPLSLVIISQSGKDDLMLKFLMVWGMELGSTTTVFTGKDRDFLLDLFKTTVSFLITLLERK